MDGPIDDHTKYSKSEKHHILYGIMILNCNLKYDTNELFYKTDSETQKTNLWLQKGNKNGGGAN